MGNPITPVANDQWYNYNVFGITGSNGTYTITNGASDNIACTTTGPVSGAFTTSCPAQSSVYPGDVLQYYNEVVAAQSKPLAPIESITFSGGLTYPLGSNTSDIFSVAYYATTGSAGSCGATWTEYNNGFFPAMSATNAYHYECTQVVITFSPAMAVPSASTTLGISLSR